MLLLVQGMLERDVCVCVCACVLQVKADKSVARRLEIVVDGYLHFTIPPRMFRFRLLWFRYQLFCLFV